MNKLNKFINAKRSELQLTSTLLGRIIQKIFAKKFVAAIRRVKPYVNKETLISVYSALVRPSIIAVKYGMFLVKHNHNDFKNYKIELLALYNEYEQ